MNKNLILGIDPSLTSLGWGIIKIENHHPVYYQSGILKTSVKNSMPQRLEYLRNEIECILLEEEGESAKQATRAIMCGKMEYPEQVFVFSSLRSVGMEETFLNSNVTSSFKLCYVRGAIMALIGRYELPYSEYKPNTIKKTLTGMGHADKEQMLKMIKLVVKNVPSTIGFDEADALAIAYTTWINEKPSIKG